MTDPLVAGSVQHFDCVIIGAGPAGLSAGLNLARARRRVLVLDSNRPRNAATMVSHGFITRDGIPPHELRRIAREELLGYSEAEFQLGTVRQVRRTGPDSRSVVDPGPTADPRSAGDPQPGVDSVDARFTVEASGVNAAPDRIVSASTVLIATGLKETLPSLPSIRSFYGLGLFSCIECDGYEQSDKPLALIGEADDLASRALLIAQWSRNLTVFTNGIGQVTPAQEALLARRGVRIERRRIADIVGHRGVVSSVLLADGDAIAVEGGFVRPRWHSAVDFADGLGLETGVWGLLRTDADGRSNVVGIYAAGDSTAPGPQQLIVAAGAGARVAATINRDLIGIPG
ncbi:MAG: NAD(P)/FAD-dependent oxidoreductase [Microbacteriaceae bacterium]